jgi:hypothetical protein
MDDPLIFDTLHASQGVDAGVSHGGARHNYDVVLEHEIPSDEAREAVLTEVTVRGYVLASVRDGAGTRRRVRRALPRACRRLA